MTEEIDFLLHRTIEYDASEGRDLFRVTATSTWISREEFERFMRSSELGQFTARIGGKNGRERKE